MITIRKSVAQCDKENIPSQLDKALNWMKSKYPNVDFDVDFIFSGAVRNSKYYRNGEQNSNYTKPTVQIETNRDNHLIYWKPSLGITRKEVTGVGREDVTVCAIIHELTHHVQYETGLPKGEVLTTQNELEWLKEFRPDVYELFTT